MVPLLDQLPPHLVPLVITMLLLVRHRVSLSRQDHILMQLQDPRDTQRAQSIPTLKVVFQFAQLAPVDRAQELARQFVFIHHRLRQRHPMCQRLFLECRRLPPFLVVLRDSI